jgi:hypothetical protein
LTRAVQLYEMACGRGDELACQDVVRIHGLRPGSHVGEGRKLALGPPL